jgi:predicted transcriptional regulator of viral defense system
VEHILDIPEGRRRLAQLVTGTGDVIRIKDAARVLELDRTTAAKTLARWASQGWLRRIRRGLYVPATLDSLNSEHVLTDPWVLVPSLFARAYIGGRTAAHYWDLTEQLFNDVVVLTTEHVRQKSQLRHGVTFTVKHIQERKIFGCKTVWRGRTRVMISDLPRTVVDMLDDPGFSGGIQQVADCFAEYLRHKGRNDHRLITYSERLGNGAVFKRLGFLAEQHGEEQLAQACRDRLTEGTIKLDPTEDCTRLVTRWRIWVPPRWKAARA